MSEPISALQYDYSLLKEHGKDVFISANVEIRRPQLVSLGNHIAIDTGFYLTTAAEFGDYIHIAPYCTIIGGPKTHFKIGHFSGFAAGCRIICASEEYLGKGFVGPTIPEKYRDNVKYAPVIIEEMVTLGTNAVVMPGVTLAQGSIIGANSLVTKSTEPWTIYVGSPARAIKKREKGQLFEYAKELGYYFEEK
jgi:galactoside O-acetyltransferase